MTIEGVKVEDSLVIDITITEDGVVKDITGGTVQAAIKSPDLAGTVTAVSGAVFDGPNGIARVTVPKDTFDVPGSWWIQCRVEIGAESQTVYHEVVDIGESLIKDVF